MAYPNKNYSRNYTQGNGGNWRGNSDGGGYNNQNQSQQNQVKKSGAIYSRIKKGKQEGGTCVNAWRKTKNGLLTASAFPVDGVEHIGSEKGKTFLRYVVEVVNRDMGTTQTFWCLMQKESKKIYIKELGLVISPNGNGITSSGKRVTGFFGKAY